MLAVNARVQRQKAERARDRRKGANRTASRGTLCHLRAALMTEARPGAHRTSLKELRHSGRAREFISPSHLMGAYESSFIILILIMYVDERV